MNQDDHKPDSDEASIPLLQDVITEEELASEYISFAENDLEKASSGIPEYDEVLLAMRDDIARQLHEDLWLMVSKALDRAIEEASHQVAKTLHKELDTTLEQRIRDLIERRLELDFGPRPRDDGDDNSPY
ncbi:MAG: hypothetical protein ABW076_01400 [Candidatus Thiodiazotropha sp.]